MKQRSPNFEYHPRIRFSDRDTGTKLGNFKIVLYVRNCWKAGSADFNAVN